jgi:hypothetical protein
MWNCFTLAYEDFKKCKPKLRDHQSPEFNSRTSFCGESRDSSVGIATGYGLDDRDVGVRVPVGSRIFSPLRRPDRLWGHLTSYPIGTQGYFRGGKTAGAWSWPLASN